MSYSTKVPASQRTSILSLAVSFPFLCWASILFCPPPRSARARVSSIFFRTLRVYWADSGASSPAMPVTWSQNVRDQVMTKQLHQGLFCPIFGRQPEAHCLQNFEFCFKSLSFLENSLFFWGKFHKNWFNTWKIIQICWKSQELLNKFWIFLSKLFEFFSWYSKLPP